MSLLHDAAATLLRRLDAETAHDLSLRALAAGLGPREGGLGDPALAVSLAELNLPNCIGLAAGYDKDAVAPDAMLAAGFGFVECGTVTPLAQPGNPSPRVFRLPRDRAVINRYGFNSKGVEVFAGNLRARRSVGVVGANLGANKESADRIEDYVIGLTRLWGLCDYFTVNISSPNTPGLRHLQSRTALEALAGRLSQARVTLKARTELKDRQDFPLFLKVAPDLGDGDIEDIVQCAVSYRLDGLIVANTTVSRPDTLKSSSPEPGGLSGPPLMDLSTRVLRRFHAARGGHDLALIAAGGVSSGADAYAKIRAGADAVQLYTALVYQGPGLVARIKRDLAKRLRADGFSCVEEARGTG